MSFCFLLRIQIHGQKLTANIVKVHINVPDALQLLLEVCRLVVDGLLHTQFALQPLALVVRARDGIHLGAHARAELAYERADGTCGARDEELLPGLELAPGPRCLGSSI